MDEDEILYEMFQKIMEQLSEDPPDGRVRILSKEPKYAVDAPITKKPNTQRGN